MGQRQIKALKRQIRREQNMLLQKTLRPKPKYVPTRLWMFFLKIFLNYEK